MSRLVDPIVVLCRTLTGCAFTVLAVAVIIQVTSRTFLPQSPVWTEELARFALLYLVAFGAGLSLRSGDLVNVDLVIHLFPPAVRRITDALTALAVGAFAAWLIPASWQFMRIGRLQTSPALEWRMDWIFAAIPIAMATLALFGVVRAIDGWRGQAPSVLDGEAEEV